MVIKTRAILFLGGLLAAGGCSTRHHVESADKAAGRVIAQKTPAVPNMDLKFTIATNPPVALDGLVINPKLEEFLGPAAEKEKGARIVPLEQALDFAVKYNRDYQTEKETLYSSALRLTGARHLFTPIFTSGGGAGVEKSDQNTDELVLGGNANVAGGWLMRDIGKITTDLFASFSRFLVGGPNSYSSYSKLTTTFARPLLRDAGYKQQKEQLTQEERNMLYDMRDFVQYRKEFSVQIASVYYEVLRLRDTTRNSYLKLQSSRVSAQRTKALAEEGRATQSDLGRLEQEVYQSEGSWIQNILRYRTRLDEYKIRLGIPVQTPVILDERELQKLAIGPSDIDIQEAIKIALESRLDYQTLQDQQEDLVRQVKLAADKFKPAVDLDAQVVLYSPVKENGFALPSIDNYTYSAGLKVDLPIDQTIQRNEYRNKLIAQSQKARELDKRREDIEFALRADIGDLQQKKRAYEIAVGSVDLAQRRVDEQKLLAELGRAKAQDQVDAENSLSDSKNALVSALVDYNTSRLKLWQDMGVLLIKENGQWEEAPVPVAQGVPVRTGMVGAGAGRGSVEQVTQ